MSFFIFIIYFFVFVFGLCIGSFLNCVIYRLAPPSFSRRKNLGGLSRSFCPRCRHKLHWFDLFPVFSFLFLRGKCRYCHKKISLQYPLVELATGLIFLIIFNFVIFNFVNLAFLFYIASSLIVIFVYDLKHYIIPDKILFPAIIITFAFRVLEFLNFEFVSDFARLPVGMGFKISDLFLLGNYFFAAMAVSGFIWTIGFLGTIILKQESMGFGDVKLAFLMGLLLGFPRVLAALFFAFFFGAIMGIILMVFKKHNLKSQIPFAPFLIAGTFIALFWGQQIVQWYMRLFII